MNDSNEYYGEKELPYEPVPHQLSNRELLTNDRRDSDPKNWMFPDGTEVDDRERLINPLQFIVAGKGPDIDKLTAGKEFWLKPSSNNSAKRIKVKVLKSRKPAPHGKRYVLLETANRSSIADFEGQEVGIFRGEASPQSIGVIHPTDANVGGGRDHSGQSNCYGVALLVKLRADRTPAPGSEIERADKIATFERDAELGTATIAVLDSGIHFTGSSDRPTIPSDVGWDFVSDESKPDGDPFPSDDHLGLHGTKICTIIKHTAPGAGILPVKVSNRNGRLTLYDALCGLEYARTHGAKVVNASWSFTATGDHDPATDYPLLLQAIRDLEESGIVVVAAAGNKSQYVVPDGQIGKDGAPKIYPACYSGIQCNVITVTTVTLTRAVDRKFRAFENYSPQFVDTGALENGVFTGRPGRFAVTGFIDGYEGSSFATPYVAAKIARVIGASTGCLSKRSLLHRLDQFHREDDLAYAIRDGGSYVTI